MLYVIRLMSPVSEIQFHLYTFVKLAIQYARKLYKKNILNDNMI